MQLPRTIGLEVLNVMVTTIKATDAGSDALGRLQFEALQQIEKWKLDAAITSQSQVTMSWLIQTGHPFAQQILELAAKYGMDPMTFSRSSRFRAGQLVGIIEYHGAVSP